MGSGGYFFAGVAYLIDQFHQGSSFGKSAYTCVAWVSR